MLGEIVETNYKLRIEFRKKVDSGEIYKDTVVDRLIASAHGHEDNEATWAARRCLLKRGIDICIILSNERNRYAEKEMDAI